MPQTNMYSFNNDGLITGELDFGSDKNQLFINDSSAAIRFVKPAQTQHGSWYHKHIDTNIFKVVPNKHGEKYLVAYLASGKVNAFWRQSAFALAQNRFLQSKPIILFSSERARTSNDDMGKMLVAHLSKLLGFSVERRSSLSDATFFSSLRETAKFVEQHPNYWDEGTPIEILCNPFMRSKTNRDWLVPALVEHDKIAMFTNNLNFSDRAFGAVTLRWDGPRGLSQATTHSRTVDEFIESMVYKSYLKADEDLQAIKDYPLSLGVFSNINLHMGAKQAIDEGYVEFFRDDISKIPYAWGDVTQFLLSSLPTSEVGKVLDFVKKVIEVETTSLAKPKSPFQNEKTAPGKQKPPPNRYTIQYSQDNLIRHLKTVPMRNRRSVAEEFLTILSKDIEDVEAAEYGKNGWVMNATKAFNVAYAKVCVLGAATDGEVETCLSAAQELFGVDLREGAFFSLKTRDDNAFSYFNLDRELFAVQLAYGANKNYKDSDKVFRSLLGDYSGFGYLAKKMSNTPLINSLRVMGETSTNPALPPLVEAALKKAAAKIDVELEKLGIERTPHNRFLYLTLPPHVRRYKINWKFYHAGITDSEEIWMFKKAGLRSKRALTDWGAAAASLPRDMYLELLRDAAGIPPVRTQKSVMF